MPADLYEGALSDPATRAACRRPRRTAALLLWLSPSLIVAYAVAGALLSWPTWPAALLAVQLIAVVVTVPEWRKRVRRYERILAVYPWQSHRGAAQVAQNGTVFLRLPDPESPGRQVSVRVRRPSVRRWRRIAAAGPEQEIWFAGDPRIGGVVALPGPSRMALALQGGAAGGAERAGRAEPAEGARGGGPGLRGASEDAVLRARAAGFGDGV